MKIQKNKILGGGGGDSLLSTSNNNYNEENNGFQNKDLSYNNQSFQNDIVITQKTNCKNENEEKRNNLCLQCNKIKINNKKGKLHELLTVDFARYNRANNGDNMNTQLNKDDFEISKNCNTQNSYSSNKVSLIKKGRINTTYKKQYNIVQSTVILLSWLFVFMLSAMIVYFTNINNNSLLQLNNVDAADSITGLGTQESPYIISDELALKTFSENSTYWGKSGTPSYAKLEKNIEYTYDTWAPIGNSTNTYYGNFDGCGYTITFTKISDSSINSTTHFGVFGIIDGATITNLSVQWVDGLNVTNSTSSSIRVGGIVAYASDSTISNCYNKESISANRTTTSACINYVGGIVGYASSSTEISCCYNEGFINVISDSSSSYGESYAGGIVGCANAFGLQFSDSVKINNCYNSGIVSANSANSESSSSYAESYAGGIVGQAEASSDGGSVWVIINNCYNSAIVNAICNPNDSTNKFYAGGIVGDVDLPRSAPGADPDVKLINCFSIKSTETSEVQLNISGGIAGDGKVSDSCYHNYDNFSEDEEYKANLSNLVKDENNFKLNNGNLVWNSEYLWDFETIWGVNGGYPYLRTILMGYTITYNAGDGATGTTYTTDLINSGTTAIILNVNDSNLNYSKTGYHFTHWSGSDGQTYNAGETYGLSVNVVLTAQWEANVYYVKFNANAPSGANSTGASSMSNQTFTYGVSQNLTLNAFKYEHYDFLGWATTSSGGVTYSNGQSVQNLTDENNGVVNLYAVWLKNSCTTTITITLNMPADANTEIIFNILDGTKQDFTTASQIAVSSSKTIKLELEKDKTYTIAITKPFSWQIIYDNGEPTTVNFFEFTTNGSTENHSIEISGSVVPNIWVVV